MNYWWKINKKSHITYMMVITSKVCIVKSTVLRLKMSCHI